MLWLMVHAFRFQVSDFRFQVSGSGLRGSHLGREETVLVGVERVEGRVDVHVALRGVGDSCQVTSLPLAVQVTSRSLDPSLPLPLSLSLYISISPSLSLSLAGGARARRRPCGYSRCSAGARNARGSVTEVHRAYHQSASQRGGTELSTPQRGGIVRNPARRKLDDRIVLRGMEMRVKALQVTSLSLSLSIYK